MAQIRNIIIGCFIDNTSINEIEAFLEWAFGDNYYQLIPREMMEAWNEKHGQKLKLMPGNEVKEDLVKMIELWRKEF